MLHLIGALFVAVVGWLVIRDLGRDIKKVTQELERRRLDRILREEYHRRRIEALLSELKRAQCAQTRNNRS